MKKTQILIIHQYAGNKGDRAVLYALCLQLLKFQGEKSIVVSTSDTELWKGYSFYETNNIKFIPWGWDYKRILGGNAIQKLYWFILEKVKKYTFTIVRENFLTINLKFIYRLFTNPQFYHEIKTSEIIISTGGHHYTTLLSRDLISPISFDSIIAIGCRKKMILWSQSIGPFFFYKKRNEKMIKQIIRNQVFIYLRENSSINELKQLLAHEHLPTFKRTFESVITLNCLIDDYIKPSKREKIVGISIYSTKHRNSTEYIKYIETLSSIVDHVAENGYSIQFFPMEMKDTEPDDRPMIKDIIKHCNKKEQCIIVDQDLETKEHLLEVSRCQLFIGHKTHSIIFSLTSGTPIIGISYHPKTNQFMREYDLMEYVINDDMLTKAVLIEKCDSLIEKLDVIGEKIFFKSKEYNKSIVSDLFSILK
jgi:polysaccharide pyruvyl transferase WcaK-like protein